jgi:F-type H+-transporting ATPase subunit b
MQFDWWTFALQVVNFAILVWLLHRFLYKPILRMIDSRQFAVAKQYDDAAAAEKTAKVNLAAIDRERANIATEREAAFKSAAAQSEEAAKQRQARAQEEAAALIVNARKTLAAEREQVFEAARHTAIDLGADMARRLLNEIPSGLRAEAWLERIESHLKGMGDGDRAGLVGAHGDLTVVTAFALPDDAKQTWTSRLHAALGERSAISFAADAALIAGVDLHFANAILRFSWQSALTKLHAEFEKHGEPV